MERKGKRQIGGKGKGNGGEVLDGSNIMELVGNEQVFSKYVDHKFHELDKDRDGKLSLKELQPAVADIGAALGLPAQGTSPDSDHIYYEVLNEFTHGKQEKVSKIEFKEVLSDILLGMAAGLKRDPIVILRMDGEDFLEFVNGPSYEVEMASIFSQIENPSRSLREHVIEAFGRLTVDRGIPPTSDSWVFNNIVDPALLSQAGPAWDRAVTQETFLEEFKKAALSVVDCLKEKPVIVAHSENTFDGSGIKRLLSNKFELDKTLSTALGNLPKDRNGKISKDYLRVALDVVSPSAGLPPVGAIEEARVTLQNYYQYRHVDKPGWKLGWTWGNKEVIWSMSGALATDRGDCSSYSGSQMPHSCKKDPIIVDLAPRVSQNRSEQCGRGGLLSALAVDPLNSFSSFELEVRSVGEKENPLGQAPNNLTFMAPGPGYTCSPLLLTDPTVSLDFGGLRQVPVLRTWKSTCTYSSFLANKSPVCCVSLSAFYNPTITSCRNCTCGGCREADKNTLFCIRPGEPLRMSNDDNVIECSDHMCPIRVHWHFKNNYMDQWRVKLTVSNYNYMRTYSNWNVLVQHPGFNRKATTYSFNSTKLPTIGLQDGIALFWGIDFYNNELLHSDEDRVGSVTTEILLEKDPVSFTLHNGWVFPRRIYFNGENCEMPLPDTFPTLPNGGCGFNLSLLSLFLALVVAFL